MEVSGTFLELVRSGRFSATRFLGMLSIGMDGRVYTKDRPVVQIAGRKGS